MADAEQEYRDVPYTVEPSPGGGWSWDTFPKPGSGVGRKRGWVASSRETAEAVCKKAIDRALETAAQKKAGT